ncbi:MAG: dihydrofolate reductase [Pseudomonadota bacterium]|nr:dihydrofolate reductase [Pseudomonadota bacterium]
MIEGLSVVAVVAAAENGVIGKDNAMPWHVPSDLKHYRAVTMGKPMIMGRRTLESIGRCLDGRDTIVLTRQNISPVKGAILAKDRNEAVEKAAHAARSRGANEIVIAGGAEIYRLFWLLIDRIVMTRIEARPEGDTFFPDLAPEDFKRLSSEPRLRGERDSAATRLEIYERRSA